MLIKLARNKKKGNSKVPDSLKARVYVPLSMVSSFFLNKGHNKMTMFLSLAPGVLNQCPWQLIQSWLELAQNIFWNTMFLLILKNSSWLRQTSIYLGLLYVGWWSCKDLCKPVKESLKLWYLKFRSFKMPHAWAFQSEQAFTNIWTPGFLAVLCKRYSNHSMRTRAVLILTNQNEER